MITTEEYYLKQLQAMQARLLQENKFSINQVPVITTMKIDDILVKPYPIEYLKAKGKFLAASNPLVYRGLK